MLVSKFRVYVPRKRRAYRGSGFWEVLIFDNAESLRAHMKSDDLRGGRFGASADAIGFCRALIKLARSGGYKPNKNGSRGMVLFCLDHVGVRVASHEWTHAAHYELASHQGREPLTLKDDERLAHLQGDLHAGFWRQFQKRFRQTGKYRKGYPVWKARPA